MLHRYLYVLMANSNAISSLSLSLSLHVSLPLSVSLISLSSISLHVSLSLSLSLSLALPLHTQYQVHNICVNLSMNSRTNSVTTVTNTYFSRQSACRCNALVKMPVVPDLSPRARTMISRAGNTKLGFRCWKTVSFHQRYVPLYMPMTSSSESNRVPLRSGRLYPRTTALHYNTESQRTAK